MVLSTYRSISHFRHIQQISTIYCQKQQPHVQILEQVFCQYISIQPTVLNEICIRKDRFCLLSWNWNVCHRCNRQKQTWRNCAQLLSDGIWALVVHHSKLLCLVKLINSNLNRVKLQFDPVQTLVKIFVFIESVFSPFYKMNK